MRTDDPRRRAELAAIHVAKKQLRLDDDLYRAIVERISARFRDKPVTSSAMMTPRERHALIDELRRQGFRKIERPAKPEESPATAQMKKILALWNALCETGKLRNPSAQGLRHFIKRQTGTESARWLTAAQSNRVIEGLKAWLERVEGGGADDAGDEPASDARSD